MKPHSHDKSSLWKYLCTILISVIFITGMQTVEAVPHPISEAYGVYITNTSLSPNTNGSVDVYLKAPQHFDVVSFKIIPSGGLSNVVLDLDTNLFASITYGSDVGGSPYEVFAQQGTSGNSSVPMSGANGKKIGSIYFTAPASGVETIQFDTSFSFGAMSTFVSYKNTTIDQLTYGDPLFSVNNYQQGLITIGTNSCVITTNASANEGDGTMDFNLQLNSPNPYDIDIGYHTSDGVGASGAAAPSDYTSINASQSLFTIPAGSSAWTHSVTIIDDSNIEGDETFTITYTDGTSGFCAGSSMTVTGTIIDNDFDTPNEYNFSANNYDIAEGDGDSVGQYTGSVDVTVTRFGTPTIVESVDLTLTPGTNGINTTGATVGKDYNYIAPITVSFSSRETSKTVSVPIQKDGIYENNETIDLQLGSYSANGYSGTMSTSKITILDDDLPNIWIDTSMNTGSNFLDTTSIYEGNSGSRSIECDIIYPSSNERDVWLSLSTAGNGTADFGDYMNYVSASSALSPGSTRSCDISTIYGDQTVEPDETIILQAPYAIQAYTAPIATLTETFTIINDDSYTVSIGPVNSFALEGTNPSINANVSVNPFPSVATEVITVDYSALIGTADSNDFTATTGTLTIDSSTPTPITITVPITDDAIDEDFENFTIELSNPSSNAILDTSFSAGVTIMDNDTAGITRDLDSITTNESGSTATIQYKLNSEPTTNVTIDLSGINAAEGTMDTTQLVFTPSNWNVWQAVIFTGVDDTLVDGPITYQITSVVTSSDSKYGSQTVSNFAVTNNDDDSVGMYITPSTTIVEGNPGDIVTANLNITFTAAPLNDITITYNTQSISGQATSDVDFTSVTNGSVVFTAADFANSPSIPLTFAILPDTNFESDEFFDVVFSASEGNVMLNTGRIIIADDDIPTYCLDGTNAGRGYQVTESGGDANSFGVNFPIQVTRTGDIQVADEIQAVFLNGGVPNIDTATGSNDPLIGDFDNTPIIIQFAAGESSKDMNFLVVDDALIENNEGLMISFNTTVNTVGTIDTTPGCIRKEVTIISDDVYEIAITPATTSISENGGITSPQITITPTPTGSDTATISYTTANGTAGGDDYTAMSGTHTFDSSSASYALSIPILDDNLDELDEDFTVSLSNPINANLGNTTSTITIIDNDNFGVSITDHTGGAIGGSPLTTNESGSTATFNIVLDSEPTDTVTIDFTGIDTTEGSLDITSISFDNTNWTTAQTITLTGLDDPDVDGNITYAVVVGITSNDTQYGALTPNAIQVTNIDNDDVNISISDTSVTEGNSGDTVTASLTVTLSTQPLNTLTVDYQTQEITGLPNGHDATSNLDFTTQTNQSLSFVPGGSLTQIISIDITSEDIYEFDQQFDVVLSNASAGRLNTDGTERGTITIVNDDTPIVTTSSPSTSRAEGNTTNNAFECTITLDPMSERSIYLALSTSFGTAIANDFSGINSTNILLDPNTPYTCAGLTTIADNTVEPHELFALTASYTEIETGNNLGSEILNFTILNDDADCYSQTEIPTNECLALVDLYNNSNGAAWTSNSNWLNYNDIASWYGITINSGNVTSIDLNTNNLVGSLVTSIGNFSVLTALDLSDNILSGGIPSEIGNLTNLTVLDISHNGFTGNLPNEIGNTSLIQLFISHNSFSGSFPTTINNVVALTHLYADNNSFSGSIPNEIYTLPSLIDLVINNNQFSGIIDPAIGSMTTQNLVKIHFQNNQLECFVPHEIGNFPRLWVNLSNNMLIDPTSNTALNTLLGGGSIEHVMMPQNPNVTNCGVIGVDRVETLLIDTYDSTNNTITFEWVVPTGNPTQYHIEAVDMATYATNSGSTWTRVTSNTISVTGNVGSIVSHAYDLTSFTTMYGNNANNYFYKITALDGQGNEANPSDIGYMIGDVTTSDPNNFSDTATAYITGIHIPDYYVKIGDAHLTAQIINWPEWYTLAVPELKKAVNVMGTDNSISDTNIAYQIDISSEANTTNNGAHIITILDAHRLAQIVNWPEWYFFPPKNQYYPEISTPLLPESS